MTSSSTTNARMFLWILGMMLTQAINAWVNILYKVSYNVGFSLRVLVVYRFIIATICILPFALIVDRSTRPAFTWRIAGLGILAGVFGGALGQNIFAASFAFAPATYSAAISILSPVVTYIMALVFRMETLILATWPGKFKLAGTILSITGATIISFYSGPNIHLWSTSVDLLQHHRIAALTQAQRPVYGIILAFSSCVCFAIFSIILRTMSRTYAYPIFSSLLFMCSSSTVFSTIYAISIERHWSAWYLEQDIRLVTMTYSGILASGLSVMLATACTRQLGPIFVSATSPFALIFTTLMGPTFLHEKIYLGSVLGESLIIIRIYVTLCGKIIEIRMRRDDPDIESVETQLRIDDLDIESIDTQLRGDDLDIESVETQLRRDDLDIESIDTQLRGDDPDPEGVEVELSVDDPDPKGVKIQLSGRDDPNPKGVEIQLSGDDPDPKGVEIQLSGDDPDPKGVEIQLSGDDFDSEGVKIPLSGRDDPDPEGVEIQLSGDDPDLEGVEIQLSEKDLDLEGVEMQLSR